MKWMNGARASLTVRASRGAPDPTPQSWAQGAAPPRLFGSKKHASLAKPTKHLELPWILDLDEPATFRSRYV